MVAQPPSLRLSSPSIWIIKNHITRTSFFFLLTLNLISLLYYLFHHPPPATATTTRISTSNLKTKLTLKPWPLLPSFLPWSPPLSASSPGSCEAFFGNGFTETADIFPRTERNGWFRCLFSGTLRSSICEGGRVRMDPARIVMSDGGEQIEEVFGRSDDEELPRFESGAFRVQILSRGENQTNPRVSWEFLERYLKKGKDIKRHTMRDLVKSIEFVDEPHLFQCSQWIEQPTLLVTRYEYANVFHTYTDWYSAYISSRVTGLPARPHVVFLDGHAK